MKINDDVRTGVALPGIPAGTPGRVKEIGRLFVVVEFRDGRQGYYPAQQLRPAAAPSGTGEDASLGFGGNHVPYGAHLCLLPSANGDVIEAAAQCTAAGLEAGDNCVCVFPSERHDTLREAMRGAGVAVEEALASGRAAIRSGEQMYLAAAEFTWEKQLARTGKVLAALAQRGGVKARVFALPRRELFGLEDWWEYEVRATPVVKAGGLVVVCAYEANGWRTDQWRRAEAAHPYVVKDGQVVAGGAPAG